MLRIAGALAPNTLARRRRPRDLVVRRFDDRRVDHVDLRRRAGQQRVIGQPRHLPRHAARKFVQRSQRIHRRTPAPTGPLRRAPFAHSRPYRPPPMAATRSADRQRSAASRSTAPPAPAPPRARSSTAPRRHVQPRQPRELRHQIRSGLPGIIHQQHRRHLLHAILRHAIGDLPPQPADIRILARRSPQAASHIATKLPASSRPARRRRRPRPPLRAKPLRRHPQHERFAHARVSPSSTPSRRRLSTRYSIRASASL